VPALRHPPPRRPWARAARGLAPALAGAAALAGCGKAPAPENGSPLARSAPANPGAIAVATKNTTRIGGADPAVDAAAVARTVYPGLTVATRPQAVVLVDERNWPAAIAASSLAGAPLGAPLLFARGDELPAVSARALAAMRPLGASALDGAQVLRIGTHAAVPGGYRTRTLAAAGDAASTAAAIARELASAQGTQHGGEVIVLRDGAPQALQMPAAGLAAESGAPILFIERGGIPAATAELLKRLHQPAVYPVGAAGTSSGALAALGRLGRVRPIGAPPGTPARSSDAIANAVAVSRFADGSFGWGIREAGHGLAFANSGRPLDAPAAAPLSAHGDYAPLLLLESSASVPAELAHYLSNIEPGYTSSVPPVRSVYNHGWLIGDEHAISVLAQAEVDAILEVAPRTPGSAEQPPAPE
jgi:hypothetical protein